MPEDKTLPNADAGPVDCQVRPTPAHELQREIESAWGRHAQRVHYSWPAGCGGHAALQSPEIMTEPSFQVAVRQIVKIERLRLRMLVEEVRDANAAAQEPSMVLLPTDRQRAAWAALLERLS